MSHRRVEDKEEGGGRSAVVIFVPEIQDKYVSVSIFIHIPMSI